MLSRIADSLFWMNRYMERSASLLRLARTHNILRMDKDTGAVTWRPVLELYSLNEKEIAALEANTEKVLSELLVSETNINSLKTLINKARENARGATRCNCDWLSGKFSNEVRNLKPPVKDSAIVIYHSGRVHQGSFHRVVFL